MKAYRGITKDGNWVKGWYFHLHNAAMQGDGIKEGDWEASEHDIHGIFDMDSGLLDPVNWEGTIHRASYHEVIPETVGQSTGLKDKKRTKEFPEGQEIYEGDIVKHPDTEQCKYSDMWIVEYEPGAWIQQRVGKGLRWPPGGDPYEKVEWDWYNIEVIGNIHQNPELLKGAE